MKSAADRELALVEVLEAPTAPMGVYSRNAIAVRRGDRTAPWVREIAEAYRSREFAAVSEERFPGFVKPEVQP